LNIPRGKKKKKYSRGMVLHLAEIAALATPVILTVGNFNKQYGGSAYKYASEGDWTNAQKVAVANWKENGLKAGALVLGLGVAGRAARKFVKPQGVKGMKVGF
jgi:hypothetical protein